MDAAWYIGATREQRERYSTFTKKNGVAACAEMGVMTARNRTIDSDKRTRRDARFMMIRHVASYGSGTPVASGAVE